MIPAATAKSGALARLDAPATQAPSTSGKGIKTTKLAVKD